MLYDPETDIFSLRSGDFAPEYVHGDTPGRLGHTVFAGLLMREVRPEILVELGTDSGNSYFAYCRSAVKNKIAVRCCAIDSREGEPQTGKYGDAVFKTVNDYNKANYSSFSTLLRGRFDDFVNRYEDASIDLLHIDGFHSCDAVKHDFQTWIGKVRPGGLVILQDVAAHREGGGVNRFWEELKQQTAEHFTFSHSHGLGIWRKPGGPELQSPILRGLFSGDREVIDAVHNLELEAWPEIYEALRSHSDRRYQEIETQYKYLLQSYDALRKSDAELFSSNFFRVFKKFHNIYIRFFPRESLRGRIVQKTVIAGLLFYRAMKNLFHPGLKTWKRYHVPNPDGFWARRRAGKKLVVPTFDAPRVSIVIPAYNHYVYTYYCIKSIIENSGDVPYEIIIADDCSMDKTKKIEENILNIRVSRNSRNVSFLLNCNRAAKAARGEFIFFLNNDAAVHPGWLSALIGTMDRAPQVGIAGAKLLYPDGRLQEAGGIVFRDASAWNYGSGDDPDNSKYNYFKECDYVSGAALMIRAALWREIGGFDERYIPAYYEDTDLCFEARRHGYKVVYQPAAAVTHFGGISNGTKVSCGIKKYQVANQGKFAEKWQETLLLHCNNGDNVFAARDRSAGGRHIFMLDHYVPTFDRDAGSRQMYCYVKILRDLGYMIHLLGDNRRHEEPYTSAFQQLGVEVLYGNAYGPGKLAEWFRENHNFISFAFLNRAHIAVSYFSLIRKYPNIKLVYYGHDVGHIRLQREFEITGDESLPAQINAAKGLELALYSSSDVNLCVGNFEYAYLKKTVPNIPVYNVPIFIYDHFIENYEPFEKRKDILFVGGFCHRPNADGVLWFLKDIFPLVRERIPEVRFHIAGSNIPKEIMKLASEHIIIEGFVSDEKLAELYRTSRIVVAPLRFGAGVKGKIIEALYHRSVVVTTSIGAEGIPVENHPFAIADAPEDFSRAVVEAYTDPAVWKSYLENSLEMIQSAYSYRNAVKILTEIFS